MRIVTEDKPVYKTKKVQVDTIPVNRYFADDGTEFNNTSSCIAYETKLLKIKNGEDQFIPFTFTSEQKYSIVRLSCDLYSPIDEDYIKIDVWNSTNDAEKINKVLEYLRVKGHYNIYDNTLNMVESGERYMIISYCTYPDSDSPNYELKIIKVTQLFNIIDDLKESLIPLITKLHK